MFLLNYFFHYFPTKRFCLILLIGIILWLIWHLSEPPSVDEIDICDQTRSPANSPAPKRRGSISPFLVGPGRLRKYPENISFLNCGHHTDQALRHPSLGYNISMRLSISRTREKTNPGKLRRNLPRKAGQYSRDISMVPYLPPISPVGILKSCWASKSKILFKNLVYSLAKLDTKIVLFESQSVWVTSKVTRDFKFIWSCFH